MEGVSMFASPALASVALAEYCTSPTSHITIRLAVDWLYHMWSKAILLLPLPYVQSASSVESGLPWFVIQTRPQACPGSRHKCRNLKVLLHKTMKASAATSSSSAQKARRQQVWADVQCATLVWKKMLKTIIAVREVHSADVYATPPFGK